MAKVKQPPPASPFLTTRVDAASWFRVHKYDPDTQRYGPSEFNNTTRGNARFSPLEPEPGLVVPTIYAAATPRAAIAEVVLHDVPTPSSGHIHDWGKTEAGPLHLSEIQLAPLKLANLTTTGLRAAGLVVADIFDCEADEYQTTRQWAVHIWKTLPDAQGMRWMSVRENTAEVIMLFGDRLSPNDITDGNNSQPIANFKSVVMTLLDELGCAAV